MTLIVIVAIVDKNGKAESFKSSNKKIVTVSRKPDFEGDPQN